MPAVFAICTDFAASPMQRWPLRTLTAMTDLELADARARERAIDPTRSILLQAPAGSGKTTVLTQRFLRLLTEVDEPEEILAITFTRKAAGEMRERILRAIWGEQAGSMQRLSELAQKVRSRSAQRGWELEASPSRLRIQTIDSLNRWLARQLPVASRAIGDLEVTQRPLLLYRQAARRALMDAETDERLQADVELLFERLDNDFDRFERLLTAMLAARAHWLPRLLRDADLDLCARVEASLAAIVQERLDAVSRVIAKHLIEQGVLLASRAVAQWDCSASALTLRHWQSLAAIALTNEGTWRINLTKREGFPPHEKALKAAAHQWIADLSSVPGAREMLTELATLPDDRLPLDDAAALEALARMLKLAASELELVFRESGLVDYPYIAAAARRALTEEGAPTDLSLRLGTRLKHILIDEFQDTSIDQFELLQALTAGWEQGDGRTLFIVGDPMQSIYQFREAEVGLFLRTRDRGLGSLRLESLALTRNFRSIPELVEWTNKTFPTVFPILDDPRASAVRYLPSLSSQSERGKGGVTLHRIAQGDAAGEAQSIAQLITKLRTREPESSIALLVAARAHAGPIAVALHEARIPVAGVDLVSLAELSVVQDLAALTRALDHFGDRTAWLAILRAPWCGLTLLELSALLDDAGRLTVWEALQDDERMQRLNSVSRKRVIRIRDVLEDALSARGRREPAQWIEQTWLRLGGAASVKDAEDLEHAEAFFTALANWAAAPDWSGPSMLEELLGELYASHATAPADAVQIMTIHRAKGLEFDKVIVPGLGRRLRASPEPLLRWLELPRDPEGSDLLMAPVTPSARRTPEPLNSYLKSLQTRRSLHERARLLYVASTRARSELHLFGELRDSGAVEHASPSSGTLLATLWPAIGGDFPAEPQPAAATADIQTLQMPLLRRLPADWLLPRIPDGPEPEVISVAAYQHEEERDFLCVAEISHCIGVVVCEQLRNLSRASGLASASQWEAHRTSLQSRFACLGLTAESLDMAVDRAIGVLSACAADPVFQWVFAPTHTHLTSPLDLTGMHEGRLASVTIDRAFVDADGTRWLIDFKPGVASDGDLEGFLAREMQRERPTLERYLAFARAMGPQPARAALYFPQLGNLSELSL
jgi:ATP-dependent exoDNAse (exonuclease V) beta subunit